MISYKKMFFFPEHTVYKYFINRNRQFWVLAMIYGITTGVYSGWGAVLNVNISTFGISQDTAGWLGFFSVFAGVAGGMLLARSDYFFQAVSSPLRDFLVYLLRNVLTDVRHRSTAAFVMIKREKQVKLSVLTREWELKKISILFKSRIKIHVPVKPALISLEF